MEELGKVTQSKDVSLETKVKIIHTFMLPISTYGQQDSEEGRQEKNEFM